MSRLIDGDKVVDILFNDQQYNDCPVDYYEGIKDAIKEINRAPAVDAVEVVRCKDCRYATMTSDGKFAKSCKIWTQARYFDADYFCADGERKKLGIKPKEGK